MLLYVVRLQPLLLSLFIYHSAAWLMLPLQQTLLQRSRSARYRPLFFRVTVALHHHFEDIFLHKKSHAHFVNFISNTLAENGNSEWNLIYHCQVSIPCLVHFLIRDLFILFVTNLRRKPSPKRCCSLSLPFRRIYFLTNDQ